MRGVPRPSQRQCTCCSRSNIWPVPSPPERLLTFVATTQRTSSCDRPIYITLANQTSSSLSNAFTARMRAVRFRISCVCGASVYLGDDKAFIAASGDAYRLTSEYTCRSFTARRGCVAASPLFRHVWHTSAPCTRPSQPSTTLGAGIRGQGCKTHVLILSIAVCALTRRWRKRATFGR